jgi:CHRD domain-containing protein
MKRDGRLLIVLTAASLAAGVPTLAAADGVAAQLNGYKQIPSTLNSTGSATFVAKINEDGTSIEYELSYGGFPTTVTQSHIHFGGAATSGGIALFLCTNLGNAPTGVQVPACPPQPATVTGTLTAADMVAIASQGLDGGAAGFAEILKAIRAGAAYVNVHTVQYPPGEVRGQTRSGE